MSSASPAETPQATSPAPIAVFVSGSGRTLANFITRADQGTLPARIAIVVASAPCKALTIAAEAGIPTALADPDWTKHDVQRLLTDAGVQFAALAGYIKKLPIPDPYKGKILNIHPALLPAHGGRGMWGLNVHRAVLMAGDTTSGCTVHIATDEYDRGPILAQATCPVMPNDTPESLAARVFDLELELYPRTLTAFVRTQRTSPPPATGTLLPEYP